MSELLDEENQRSIQGILANTEEITRSLADRSPEIAATLAEARVAIAQAGQAAAAFERVAGSTDRLLNEQGQPLVTDLRHTIRAAETSMENLDALIADARPGVDALTKQTIPEIGLLVRDMRELTTTLRGFSERLEQEGIGGALGPEKLPDYKPRKR